MTHARSCLLLLLTACGTPDGRAPADPDLSGAEPVDTGFAAAPPGLTWREVQGGRLASCGLLDDGRVLCWGDPAWVEQTSPLHFDHLSVSSTAACGVKPDGGLGCWCPSGEGLPVCDEAPTDARWIDVQVTGSRACAEDEAHRLRCWGTMDAAPDGPVTSWGISDNFGCATRADGEVTCWGGTNALGEDAPPADRRYVQVSVGVAHACALDDAGEIACWGRTQWGNAFPAAPAGPWMSVQAAGPHACALRAGGAGQCWSDPSAVGPLADHTLLPDGERWSQLGIGETSSCGLTRDGRALCFPAESELGEEQHVPDLTGMR